MIFLEQTVNQILKEEGQTILSLSELGITWKDLEDLFVGTFEQCKGYISIYDWESTAVGSTPTKRADVTHIKHITYNPVNYMQRLMPDVLHQYWEFNPYTKNLSSIYNSNFSLEVGKYPTCEQLDYTLEFKNVRQDNKIAFSLPFVFDVNNFSVTTPINGNPEVLNITATESKEELQECEEQSSFDPLIKDECICCGTSDGTIISLEGDDGTGSFNEKNLIGNLTLNADYDKIIINFKSKYVGIKELNLTCEIFYNWFKGNLLTMIGAIKKQTDMNGSGLPFDVNQDDLLARGREIMQKVEELKANKSHWSNF